MWFPLQKERVRERKEERKRKGERKEVDRETSIKPASSHVVCSVLSYHLLQLEIIPSSISTCLAYVRPEVQFLLQPKIKMKSLGARDIAQR